MVMRQFIHWSRIFPSRSKKLTHKKDHEFAGTQGSVTIYLLALKCCLPATAVNINFLRLLFPATVVNINFLRLSLPVTVVNIKFFRLCSAGAY